ncbi:MAG: hypothetical protein JWL95_2042 [Gemmatimonadetes bacterium]|nr:hypothetical protein [Gemmatimonadota bacterium]
MTEHTEEARVFVWCDPPTTELPLRAKSFRFAIGTPNGLSTNSWKVWVQRNDAYVACRDNFKEIKVSLHASGTWRLGFTEQAINDRPDLVPIGGDRAIQKWRPPLDQALVSAFYLLAPPASLYLKPEQRRDWPRTVLFIEPETRGAEFVTVCVVVARTRAPVDIVDGTRAVVLGVIPLGTDRSVQILATYEPAEPLAKLLVNGLAKVQQAYSAALPQESTIVLFGKRSDDIPWFCALSVDVIARAALDAEGTARQADV